jgi:hypothetical protein
MLSPFLHNRDKQRARSRMDGGGATIRGSHREIGVCGVYPSSTPRRQTDKCYCCLLYLVQGGLAVSASSRRILDRRRID